MSIYRLIILRTCVLQQARLQALDSSVPGADMLAVGDLGVSEGEEADDIVVVALGSKGGEAVAVAELAAPARGDALVDAAVRGAARGAVGALAVVGVGDKGAAGLVAHVVVDGEAPGAAGVVASAGAAGVADGPVGVALDSGGRGGGGQDGSNEGLGEEHFEVVFGGSVSVKSVCESG